MTFDITDKNNHPGKVLNLEKNRTKARCSFKGNNGELCLVDINIPDKWQNVSICLVCIAYLQSSSFKQLKSSTRGTHLNVVKTFFQFLGESDHEPFDNSKVIIHPIYINYLKEKYKETRVYDTRNFFGKILDWAMTQSITGHQVHGWDDITRAIKRNLPKIDKPRNNPKPAMSQLYQDCPYTDYQLIYSLRHTVSWFILESKRQKELLIEINPNLLNSFDKLESKSYQPWDSPLNGLPSSGGATKKIREKKGKAYLDLVFVCYEELIRTILESNDKLLIEKLFYSRKEHVQKLIDNNYKSISLEHMIECIEPWLSPIYGLKKQYTCPSTGKITSYTKIETVSLSELIFPSLSEITCMNWLLASDRIQSAGIETLLLEDCHLDKKAFQVTAFDKDRSSQNPKIGISYKKNTIIYDVFSYWLNLHEKNIHRFQDWTRKDHVSPIFHTKIMQRQRTITNSGFLPFQLLGFSGTLANKQCLEENPHTEIFLNYFFNSLEQVKIRMKNDERNYQSCKKEKSQDKYIKLETTSISIDLVSRSRTELDNNRDNAFQDDELDAMSTAHSAKTKKEIYKDRSQTKETIKMDGTFAAQVGNRMVEDATTVSNMLNNVQLITIDELEVRLDLKSPLKRLNDTDLINQILEEAEAHDYSINLYSEMTKDGETFILTTPLTAALITGYIKHIESEIPVIANDNPSKVPIFNIQKLYLQEVLNRFPSNITKKGMELLEGTKDKPGLSLPYPSLA